MKTNGLRTGLALCAFGAAIAAAIGPAAARLPDPPSMAPVETLPVVLDKQPAALESPPPSVLAPAAADACRDDVLQSYRTVPLPVRYDVTACGTVLSVGGAPARGARVAPTAFVMDVDGTDGLPIEVRGNPGTTVQPGQSVLVQGQYFREKSSAEYIDASRGTVQPYAPPPSPAVQVTSSPSSLPTLPPANVRPSPIPRGTPMVPQPARSPNPAPSLLPH